MFSRPFKDDRFKILIVTVACRVLIDCDHDAVVT